MYLNTVLPAVKVIGAAQCPSARLFLLISTPIVTGQFLVVTLEECPTYHYNNFVFHRRTCRLLVIILTGLGYRLRGTVLSKVMFNLRILALHNGQET